MIFFLWSKGLSEENVHFRRWEKHDLFGEREPCAIAAGYGLHNTTQGAPAIGYSLNYSFTQKCYTIMQHCEDQFLQLTKLGFFNELKLGWGASYGVALYCIVCLHYASCGQLKHSASPFPPQQFCLWDVAPCRSDPCIINVGFKCNACRDTHRLSQVSFAATVLIWRWQERFCKTLRLCDTGPALKYLMMLDSPKAQKFSLESTSIHLLPISTRLMKDL